GKKLSVPTSGHTNDYFTIEEWNSDIEESERDVDCKVSSMAISIPANGNATVNFGFLGRNASYATSQYFVDPTAAPSGEILAGPTGLLSYNGVDSVVLTSVDLSLDTGAEIKSVVGSNLSPDVFVGSVVITGSMSALYEDSAILGDFDDEVEAPLYIYLFADSTANSDFVIIKLPNIKINSADKSADGTAISLSSNFSAGILADGSTTKEQTTIAIIDSSI
ncbi:phage tail tube protein, partial [Flavobacterium sp.]|uniref:phage tail tube protein n=1 Tax=Flavobacterium sp. TaxID=239 RepID=UPI0037BE4003